MIFKDNKHKNAFYKILDKMQFTHTDTERTALAYLLALNEEGLIKRGRHIQALKQPVWRLISTQTGGKRTYRANITLLFTCLLAVMLLIFGKQ